MMGSIEKENGNEQLNDYYVDNTVFVAVGKHVEESESVLLWAAKKFAGKKRICILHVHQPSQLVTFFDGRFTTSKLKQRAIKAFRELDVQKIHKLVGQYVQLLSQTRVHTDRMWIELENIEEGIVKMVVQHRIKWLVMGAASDKHYTKDMVELKSRKAIFVCEQAPVSCHIWFVYRGNLIYTREGRKINPGVDISLAPQSLDSVVATEESNRVRLDDSSSDIYLKPKTSDSNTTIGEDEQVRLDVPGRDIFQEQESEEATEEEVSFDGHDSDKLSLDSNEAIKESEHVRMDCVIDNRGSPPWSTLRERGSVLRACSVDFDCDVEKRTVLSSPRNNAVKEGIKFEGNMQRFGFRSSFNSALFEGKMAWKARLRAPREIHDRLEQAISDAENLKQAVFEESVKRWKAEEDVMDAKNQAEVAESKYNKEMKQRKEMEESLAKQKLECQRFKDEHEKYTRELPVVRDQCSDLRTQIRESELSVKELENKIISAVELLISFRGKRDQLRVECDKAIRETESLRRLKEQKKATLSGLRFSTFSLLDISEATCSFDPSKRIGDGKYGSIYHGILRHVEVAIRMLPSDGSHGQLRFEREVEILSRVRHPNIVMLIGVCPEARCVVYEYLEKGSLEHHISSRGKIPPLQWQTRVRIATELCSALIFLHSNNPPIFHGNLKPNKILLDANFISKIGDLGIFRLIPQNHASPYFSDPEFLRTGLLNPDSDVYSFGVIILRLLTGRPESGVVKDVSFAIEKDKFESVLDFSAGEWPIYQAKTLAQLGLRCCERNRSNRPDLALEVWSVLEPFRKSCDVQVSSCLEKKENRRPPSHFLCPIYKEVMKDPYTAADGFTYEGDAIRGWLDSGRKTSPMTNLKLPNCDLIPNHALQYATQEWLQRS